MNIKIIKKKMKEKKLSNLALANIINMDDKGLGKIVNGSTQNPHIDTIIKIAKVLELSNEEFLELCGYDNQKDGTCSMIRKDDENE